GRGRGEAFLAKGDLLLEPLWRLVAIASMEVVGELLRLRELARCGREFCCRRLCALKRPLLFVGKVSQRPGASAYYRRGRVPFRGSVESVLDGTRERVGRGVGMNLAALEGKRALGWDVDKTSFRRSAGAKRS